MTAQEDIDGTVTGINVTPLVDVMLVLLIVFMVTAHFVSDSGLKVNLPKAATTESSATAALTVTLNDKGELFLMEQGVDMNGLKSNLAREAKINPTVRVTLAADQNLPYRQIVEVLDAVKQAGVKRVALASEK
jgi:biopolymer transport protein ExbD